MLNIKINPALGIIKSLEQEQKDINSPLFKLIFNIKAEIRIEEHESLHYFAEIFRKAEIEKREMFLDMQAKEISKEKARLEREEEAYHQLLQPKPDTTQRDLDRWLDALLAYPPTAKTPDKLAAQLAIHHYMLMDNYHQQIAAQLGPKINLAVLPDIPGRAHWNLITPKAAIEIKLDVPPSFKAPALITEVLKHNPGLKEQIIPTLSAVETSQPTEGLIPPPPPPPADTSHLYAFACHHANANAGYFRAMNMAREIIEHNLPQILAEKINPDDHKFIHRVIDHIDFSMKQLKDKAHAVAAALQQNDIRSLLLEFRPNKDEIPAEAMTAEPVFIEKPYPISTTITEPTTVTATTTNTVKAIPAEKPDIVTDAPRRRLKPGHNLP